MIVDQARAEQDAPEDDGPARLRRFVRVERAGERASVDRTVAVEAPVAIEVNGIGYAVLMATPSDLTDLAIGFALAERLIDGIGQVAEVEDLDLPAGHLVRLTLTANCAARVADRVRHRVAESSCGLCGIENLEQALRPLPVLPTGAIAPDAAIFAALDALRPMQALNGRTGAVHGAAACTTDGAIRLLREDVGRHNAFDKLIGAMLRAGLGWDGGFALLTSRCSYELVEKAVLSGCPMLATISAATTLALSRAEEAGLALRTLARSDALLASDI